jgi:hypothetical protein
MAGRHLPGPRGASDQGAVRSGRPFGRCCPLGGCGGHLRWGWDNSYSYSARSCYRAMFGARIEMVGALQIRCSRAPPNCRVFLWLAARNMCWTADRLSRRGLPYPVACPFCDQVEESLDHLLVGCVLAREVWPVCLRWWGKLGWIPQANTRFVRWYKESGAARGRTEISGQGSRLYVGASGVTGTTWFSRARPPRERRC